MEASRHQTNMTGPYAAPRSGASVGGPRTHPRRILRSTRVAPNASTYNPFCAGVKEGRLKTAFDALCTPESSKPRVISCAYSLSCNGPTTVGSGSSTMLPAPRWSPIAAEAFRTVEKTRG